VLIVDFILGIVPPEEEDKTSFLFLFRQRNLLVKKLEKGCMVPDSDDLALPGLDADKLYIGSMDGHSCYTASYPEAAPVPGGMEFVGLRELYGQIDECMLKAAFRAVQILEWDETHRFCGACGEATERRTEEHARV